MMRLTPTILVLMAFLMGCQPKPDISMDCAEILAGCHFDGIQISTNQRPKIMQPFELRLSIDDLAVSEVYASFGMEGMEMGLNRYKMKRVGEGIWQAEVTLPVCVRGRADWMLQLDAKSGLLEQRYLVKFRTD